MRMKMTIHRRGWLTRTVAGLSRILGVFALPLFVMLVAGSGTANASVLQLNGNLCANVSGAATTDLTPVIAWACNGDFNEQWEYVNGQFLGLGTTGSVSKCLDIRGFPPNPPGAVVELYHCNGGQNQQWEVLNGALFGFQNGNVIYNAFDQLCLDSSGGFGKQLTVEVCNGSRSQIWKVE